MIMQIVTTSKFRAKLKMYLDMAEKETILIFRKNATPIMVTAVKEGDILSKEELQGIQSGIDDVKNGNTIKMDKDESLNDFCNRIEG